MQKKIEGYDLIRQIGSGGFGEVYLAKQKVINRDVAIKVILPLYANREDFIRRFDFEAELIANLENPYVVPIYDYWRDPTAGAYLVMRYIKDNLADHLYDNGALGMVEAARLLEQIASALHTAHRKRVIHQDIKPANILLDDDGNAYLTDFGIARDIDANVDLSKDDSNTMHGSPKYISPEHLRRREITVRSDIYSLGILMYEVLTGHPPFDHDDMLQLLQMHIKQDLPPLSKYIPELPDALNQPLQQATLKDPMMRYGSVMDFARDFQMVVMQQGKGITGTIRFPETWIIEDTQSIEVRNPYKGLRAFKESDKDDFYGRESLIKSLMESMVAKNHYQRFMAIVGASGSGKSSVVRAGLIPALRNGDIDGLPLLFISTMIPGNAPMRSLEGAILRVASRASVTLMETIAKDKYDLNQALISALPDDGELVLLIDQFEELFTQVTDESKRQTFLDMIYEALTVFDSRLRVIATLRADFLDLPLQYNNKWGQLFRERMELIPAMSQVELRSAIEDPAQANGLSFETGLTAMILADVNSERGALPLLQYALGELCERCSGVEMTIEAYQQMGGISGALAKRADELYLTLDADEREIARLVFTRLVRVNDNQEHTRQRRLLGDLHSIKRDTEKIQSVIDTFGKYRLLTFDNDTSSRLPTVEIVHEALIRSWDLLGGWIADNVDALRLQSRVSDASALWLENKQDESYLATGVRLQQFVSLEKNEIVALTKQERDYITASIQADEARKLRARQRQRLVDGLRTTALVLGVLAGIAAIFAFIQRNEAVIARDLAQDNAQESRARELAASSLLFAESQPDRALLLSLASLDVQETFEGQNALLTGLLTQDNLVGYYNGHADIVRAVAVSQDGTRLVTGGQDGTVILWDTSTRTPLWQINADEADTITPRMNALAFHPDGTQVASGDGEGNIIIYDTSDGNIISQQQLSEQSIRALSYAPDGQQLASGNTSGDITLWETNTYTDTQTINTHGGGVIYVLRYSPDGSILASGGDDDLIRLWSTEDMSDIRIIVGHENWVLSLAFSPDGMQLISGSLDRTVRHWEVATGEQIWGYRSHTSEVFAVTFTDDGELAISGDATGRIIIWDVAGEGSIRRQFFTYERTGVLSLADHNNSLFVTGNTSDVVEMNIGFVPRLGQQVAISNEDVTSLAIAPDGTLAYAGGDDTDFNIYLLTSDADTPTNIDHHANFVEALVWQDNRLISGSIDRTVAIWENQTLIGTINLPDAVVSLAVSDDTLAIGLNSGIISLWDIAGDDETTWSEIGTLMEHNNRISDLAFNSSGTQLVSGSRDGTVILWDVATQSPLFEPFTDHTDAIESVAFHPTQPIIASGSRDQNIILWDANTGAPLGPALEGHNNWVTDIAFSPDGTQMTSVSADQGVILWDVASQRILGLAMIGHQDWITSVAYTPTGEHIITGGRDQQLFRWQTDLSTWRETACAISNRAFTASEERDFFTGETLSTSPCDDG